MLVMKCGNVLTSGARESRGGGADEGEAQREAREAAQSGELEKTSRR